MINETFKNQCTLTLRGGGIGLGGPLGGSKSDVIDDILSVERPFDNLGLGAGGGGFCGLLTNPNFSAVLTSWDKTSLFPVIYFILKRTV